VSASGFGFCAASSEVGAAFLEGRDFAEPDVVPGLGEPGLGVGSHLLEPSELGGVGAQEPAAGAGVFVDARGAVGAVAVAEGDLAEQEVLFELGSLVAGGSALLGAVAQLATVLDERFVGGDEVLGEHRGVAAGGVEAEVAEQGRGDVQREAGADELGGEQAPEVVRGEPDGFAVIGEAGPVGGGVEHVADGEEGDDLVPGAAPAGEQVRQGLAVGLLVGS
jgi:hypothetical protein